MKLFSIWTVGQWSRCPFHRVTGSPRFARCREIRRRREFHIFLTQRARVNHDWKQTVIASYAARWGRAWWSSYRLPWPSARVWLLMSLCHDPGLTRLSGLRRNTCSDPLGRHTFQAQAASCGARQGALWQTLLRQPMVRAVGPSRNLPGRSEDTQRPYHRVRTRTTIRNWGSHLPTGRARHSPTRSRTLRHRHAERALCFTALLPYCPFDVAVLSHFDRTTPLGLSCAVDLIDTAARKQQPLVLTAVIDFCARAGGIYATSVCHLAALGVVAIGSVEPATNYGSFRTPAERQ